MNHFTFAGHPFYKNCYTFFIMRILCDWSKILPAMIKAFSKASSGVCLVSETLEILFPNDIVRKRRDVVRLRVS